jgi:hypothetical protein
MNNFFNWRLSGDIRYFYVSFRSKVSIPIEDLISLNSLPDSFLTTLSVRMISTINRFARNYKE